MGLVLLIRWLWEPSTGSPSKGSESALDILKKRYARGEIIKEEFEEKKKDLL
ncbi:MAG: SHOCT domain-containing protein [candidate division NC10 bacterium]|nr:SHOCT domain-containing protein [candidate division NC10 bacterium]